MDGTSNMTQVDFFFSSGRRNILELCIKLMALKRIKLWGVRQNHLSPGNIIQARQKWPDAYFSVNDRFWPVLERAYRRYHLLILIHRTVYFLIEIGTKR